MAIFELTMPKLGESIFEATILKWLKQPGDEIEAEESLLEIATDKVDSEVPSPVDGILTSIQFQEGEVVPIGAVIALIETEADGNGHEETKKVHEVTAELEKTLEVPYVPKTSVSEQPAAEARFYSPLVLNIARKEGISMTQLEAIGGTGRGGRVTKKDILNFVQKRKEEVNIPPIPDPIEKEPEAKPSSNGTQEVMPKANQETEPVVNTPPVEVAQPLLQVQRKQFRHTGTYEVQEMDRMRKLIAENMTYSKAISAHVTSFVEVDVTELVQWRNKVKGQFQDKYGEKLTFTPIFIEALVKVLREYPLVNASLDGENILLKKDINVGIAVALPTDNLIVPVIKHADRLNLAGLAASVNDLAARARTNKLKADELDGGTYTLSNIGSFGSMMGTPIIMQPQLAILAVGAIRKLPAVLETPSGDVIGIRHKMIISHSYDHRIIDGAMGSKFAARFAELLEDWDLEKGI